MVFGFFILDLWLNALSIATVPINHNLIKNGYLKILAGAKSNAFSLLF